MGNEAAKTLLTTLGVRPDDIAFFIVGHAAPQSTRKAMVDWLRSRYPSAKILLLNPPNEEIDGADYNQVQDGPELWLEVISAADVM